MDQTKLNSGDLEFYRLKVSSQQWPGQFGTPSLGFWGRLVCTLVAVNAIYFLNSLTEIIPLMSTCSAQLELSRIKTFIGSSTASKT